MDIDKNIEELFNLRFTIEEDVLLNLKVNIPRDNNEGVTYYNFPLHSLNIIKYLEEESNNFEEMKEINYAYILSILSFFSREIFWLTEAKEIRDEIDSILSLLTFDERREKIFILVNEKIMTYLFPKIEKEIFDIVKFIDKEIDYAEKCGLDKQYHNYIIALMDNIVFNQAIKTDFQYFLKIFSDTFEIAKKIIKDIDLTKYETILEKKVNLDDMILSIERIENLFFHKFDTEKAFTQFKIKNHHLSFLFEDNLVTSTHTGEPILERLTAGLINIAVSENLINIVNKRDESKFKLHIEILKLYNVEEEKIFVPEELLLLIKSKKFIKHIPSVVLSNAYGGLGENQVFALSKFLLPSLNLNTAKTQYPKLNFINISTEITYFEEGSYFFD